MNNGKTDTSYTGIELKREKCLCQQEWIEIEYNAKLPDLDSGVIQYHSILWEGDGGDEVEKRKNTGKEKFYMEMQTPFTALIFETPYPSRFTKIESTKEVWFGTLQEETEQIKNILYKEKGTVQTLHT